MPTPSSKLPALPDRIRADLGSESLVLPLHVTRGGRLLTEMVPGRQHGVVYSSTGYAVCLSHTHALVWPYAANSASPETFTFALPYPSQTPVRSAASRLARGPFRLRRRARPRGCDADNGEDHVLGVYLQRGPRSTSSDSSAMASKIPYPVSSLASMSRRLSMPSRLEFLLVFSSGRLAYMGVRDGHGRPGDIHSVLPQRRGPGCRWASLGSIRHALKNSALRGDVAAVRASPATKVGERIIFAATARGKVFAWRVHRGANHDPPR